MSSLFNGPVPKVPEVRDGTSIEQLEDASGVKNPPFDELDAEATKNERAENVRANVVVVVVFSGLVVALLLWAKKNGLF